MNPIVSGMGGGGDEVRAIRRDIDLKFIQDTYRVVLNSLKTIDLHRYIAFRMYSHITKTET